MRQAQTAPESESAMKKWKILVTMLTLTGCAMPAADQGQGGSTGATPLVVINVGTGGGVTVTNTSAPTAAPASSASSAQSATNDVKPAVGDSAIKAATGVGTVEGAVKTLTGDGTVVLPASDVNAMMRDLAAERAKLEAALKELEAIAPPKPETPSPAVPDVK